MCVISVETQAFRNIFYTLRIIDIFVRTVAAEEIFLSACLLLSFRSISSGSAIATIFIRVYLLYT